MDPTGQSVVKQGGVDMSLESGMQTSQSIHSQLSSSMMDGSGDESSNQRKER